MASHQQDALIGGVPAVLQVTSTYVNAYLEIGMRMQLPLPPVRVLRSSLEQAAHPL